MKTKTQNQRLLSYLKKNRKGITTMEAFSELGICRLSERIRELEAIGAELAYPPWFAPAHDISRTRETSASGVTVTRYKLAR